MDAWAAARMARELMACHGLRGWAFAFNRRKCGMGLCRYGPKRIELSIYFVTRNEDADVRDTILHEIAHALAGPRAGHGARWRAMCLKVGAAPERCGVADMPRGVWRASCPGCGAEHHRHRRPMRGRTYYCRACGAERGKLAFARRGQAAAAA